MSERNIPADTEVLKVTGALAKCIPLSGLSPAHMCPSVAYQVRGDWLRIGFEYYWFAWSNTTHNNSSFAVLFLMAPKCLIF